MTAATDSAGKARLAALEAQLARDLEFIEAPLRSWVPVSRDAEGNPIPDVIIVGAGLSGLSIAFGLRRQGVERVLLLDAAAENDEGPWVTTARMRTLRSPKTLTGPDLGVPSLTYRAWHEAVHGADSWAGLEKIDRRDWMAYLGWFRRVAGLDIRNNTRLVGVAADGDRPALRVESEGKVSTLVCRKLVLATGIDGAGGLFVPAVISSLPRGRWTHSGERFDVDALRGRRIGVVGAAASGFDWAVAALRAGAASVTLLARSTELPRTEILDWSNFPGFLNHFADLDDTWRYRFARRLLSFRTPPTQEMYDAAHSFPNFRMVLGAPLEAVSIADDGRIALSCGMAGSFAFDHLLLGTGYEVDLARRPELAALYPNIALWRDRFSPPEGESDDALLNYPYLGPAFEFIEKRPGATPGLRHVHLFNNGAVPSLGPVCNGITGLKAGVPRIVAGLSRGLFADDADAHYSALCGYRKQHFDPSPARR